MSIRSSLWTGRIPSLIESLGADLIEEPRINTMWSLGKPKNTGAIISARRLTGGQWSFHCGLARSLQIFPAKVWFNLQHAFPAIVLKRFHLSLSFDAFPESHRSFEYPYGFCSNSVSRINCKLPGCLQIPKMLVQAAINGANTSSKLRPLAKPTSLLQEKKSARHTAQQRHFQVTSSRNVMSLFLSLGGGLIRSHVLPCFPFFWWNGSLILHNVATRKHFFSAIRT